MNTEQKEKITTLIMEMLSKFKVPGLSLSIVEGNELVFERGFGYRNIEQTLPMTENTLVGIGSVTKSFTAIAILQLQEKGLLNIEDPIVKYFPWFPQNPDNSIKIKHMLSHSTGIPALDGAMIPYLHNEKRHIEFTPMVSRQDLEWWIKNGGKERMFEPGEEFFYNNDMYILLQYLIEDLTGIKFTEYMKQNVLDPIGMTRTCYTQEDVKNDSLKDVSTGYKIKEKKVIPIQHFFTEFLYGGGGILSSAHEMAKYIQTILQKGRFGDSRLLKSETAELLWTPVVKNCPYTYKSLGNYCLGWTIEQKFGTTLIKHGGGLSSSTTMLAVLPDKNIGVFAIENDSKSICSVVVEAILANLTGNNKDELPFFKFRKITASIVGTYKAYRDMYTTKVELKGNMIMMHLENDDGEMDFPIEIRDADNLIFTIPVGFSELQQKIRFIKDKDSHKVAHLIYDRYIYHKK
jgi:CubicO group peptidase (beta-lactamase class C family)